MKTLKEITVTIAALCFVVAVVWRCREAHRPPQIVEIERPMSIAETQQKLIDLGFGDTIKGKLIVDDKDGPITRQALCDFYASREFKK
jgi:hypothetical protein